MEGCPACVDSSARVSCGRRLLNVLDNTTGGIRIAANEEVALRQRHTFRWPEDVVGEPTCLEPITHNRQTHRCSLVFSRA